ncbi:MAG: FAD-binding oxidoreductase [Alcaligenaceae bacterium]|nr:MAG: FAD-binding oxidoreductase [Alcaligenaceae bacterium]
MVVAHSWGRLSQDAHTLRPLLDHPPTILPLAAGERGLPHGMGRSYGDVGLNPGGTLWLTALQDRMMSWDEATGTLTCEAGVLLQDIQRVFVPRGWMLPVTPGTQIVTVGGAIANDVHGKNHHVRGSFGDHVSALELLRTDGSSIRCGPQERSDWFSATVGGMGLTGVITRATLRLVRIPSAWLDTETIPYQSLDTFFSLADASESHWEHTVSWIDCLSARDGGRNVRGIFLRANMAAADANAPDAPPRHRPRTVPFAPPFSLVNRATLRPFNAAYYHLNHHRAGPARQHYVPFFYPLDNLQEWNRIYGRPGFYQYQCVVPRASGPQAIAALLREITASGQGSFLGVLKTFGNRESVGLMSFPQPGVTLALDFPNLGSKTLQLFERLDSVVAEAGGRLYSAKDARMPRALFEAGYPKLAQFLPFRDPGIQSAMSQRLMGW